MRKIVLMAKKAGARDWGTRRTFPLNTGSIAETQDALNRARSSMGVWKSIEPSTEFKILC